MVHTDIEKEIEIISNNAGFDVLDCSIELVHGRWQCIVVFHSRNENIGSDELAKLYRAIMPRLEILLDTREIHLEASSPGIRRIFKSKKEYQIFSGRRVRIITSDGNDYSGILGDSNDEHVCLKIHDKEKTIEKIFTYAEIKKTQLDDRLAIGEGKSGKRSK